MEIPSLMRSYSVRPMFLSLSGCVLAMKLTRDTEFTSCGGELHGRLHDVLNKMSVDELARLARAPSQSRHGDCRARPLHDERRLGRASGGAAQNASAPLLGSELSAACSPGAHVSIRPPGPARQPSALDVLRPVPSAGRAAWGQPG